MAAAFIIWVTVALIPTMVRCCTWTRLSKDSTCFLVSPWQASMFSWVPSETGLRQEHSLNVWLCKGVFLFLAFCSHYLFYYFLKRVLFCFAFSQEWLEQMWEGTASPVRDSQWHHGWLSSVERLLVTWGWVCRAEGGATTSGWGQPRRRCDLLVPLPVSSFPSCWLPALSSQKPSLSPKTCA